MRRLFFSIIAICAILKCSAGDGDQHITANVGIMAPYTLDMTVGYEHPIGYGHAIEAFGEVGDHWQTPVCHRFWKGWFWDVGCAFKYRLARFKNGNFRMFAGLETGLTQKQYFFGTEVGFEFNYVLPNNWVFAVSQKNNFNFLHGDWYRGGVMIGIKIPL